MGRSLVIYILHQPDVQVTCVSPASHTPDHFLFSLPGHGPQIIISQTLGVSLPPGAKAFLPSAESSPGGHDFYSPSVPTWLQWLLCDGWHAVGGPGLAN